MQRLPLTLLPTTLAEAEYESVPYRAVYEAARSARIPARLGRNGRWTFDPQELPAIADALGLTSAYAD